MRAWFDNLQPRERWIVIAGAILGAGILIWGGLINPLRTRSATLASAVESKQRLLVDIARLEASGGAAPNRPTGGEQTLVVLVSGTAQGFGLTFPRSRPNGPNGIDVTFQGAPFDALIDWLVTLHDSYGIVVDSASFSSGRTEGLVNGQLSLQRP